MAEPSLGPPPSVRSPEDRLDSWKEIAAYLSRDVTTVQRWEKREGMPVHRHLHDKIGSVYAFRAELDAWTRSRNLHAARENAAQENSVQENRNRSIPLDPPAPSPQSAISTSRTRWRVVSLLAAAGAALAIGIILWLQKTEYFWRNPLINAHFQTVTDFGGVEQAAAISRDGHFVAFLSDRDGQMDVWVTQVGSGQFHNLTRGSAPELVNPSLRNLSFSRDNSLVTYWVRRPIGAGGGDISVWAVPTLGGQPQPYLEGVAEFDWSNDGSRLAYHTPGPGDPLFVSNVAQPASNLSAREQLANALPSSPPPQDSTLTFPCGRPTRNSSTSSRARSQTNWTSGAFPQVAALPNASPRITHR